MEGVKVKPLGVGLLLLLEVKLLKVEKPHEK
jgi:hypothetical protein